MVDQFLTLQSATEGYYMERGSKFLAYAFPIESEEEAQLCLQKIKKEHPKARHYCTAMRLYPDASLERSSDDGEPSGSAGRPILGQLVKNNLTNVFAIVVRYFGGTKLGIPGLIEAYKTSTANAISSGRIIQRTVFVKVRFSLPYESFPAFLNYCKQHQIPVFEESFTDTATIVIGFPQSSTQQDLMESLRSLSQMDFEGIAEYLSHLKMEIEILPEQKIL